MIATLFRVHKHNITLSFVKIIRVSHRISLLYSDGVFHFFFFSSTVYLSRSKSCKTQWTAWFRAAPGFSPCTHAKDAKRSRKNNMQNASSDGQTRSKKKKRSRFILFLPAPSRGPVSWYHVHNVCTRTRKLSVWPLSKSSRGVSIAVARL